MALEQLLEIVAMRFATTGEWPKAEDIRRRLAASAVSVEILRALPEKLGRIDNAERVILTLRALRNTGAAADVVDDFMKASRYAAARYRDWDSSLILSSEDLGIELSLSPLRARRALTLLESEGLLHPIDAGTEAGEVTAAVDRFASVRSSRAYVRARAQGSSCSRRTGLRSWLRRRDHTTRDLIAIAFLSVLFGLAAAALPRAIDQNPLNAQPSPPTKPSRSSKPARPPFNRIKGKAAPG
jgi:hypothetical protein